MRPTLVRLGAWLCVSLLVSWHGARAHGQSSRYQLRTSLELATMVSTDQVGRLDYDRVGLLGSAQLAYAALPQLSIQLGAVGGGFFSRARTGGLLAPMLGVSVHPAMARLSPYAAIDLGAGVTGSLVRPFLRLSVGFDMALARGFALGPALGYGHLIQSDQPGSSSDARYLWAGVSFAHRPRFASHSARSTHSERVIVVERAPAPSTPPARVPERESVELFALLERALPSATTRIELLAPVLFAFDSDLLEPVGVAMLHEVAGELMRRPELERLAIQGYADGRGSAEYNRALSERRAKRVLEWLVEHGVERARLEIEAEGATSFVEAGMAERAHEQNRRVVFRVLETAAP